MLDWNGIYSYLWLVFYAVAIFTPFFLLGGIKRLGLSGKGSIIVGFLLAVTYIFCGFPYFALIFALLGFISGWILNLSKGIYQFTILFGLIAAFCDTILPSGLVLLSPRISVIFVFITIILAVFFIALFAVLAIMKFVKRGSQQMALISAFSIVVLTVLAVHELILLALLCTVLIGFYAKQSDFTPYILRSLSFRAKLLIIAAYIVLFELRYEADLVRSIPLVHPSVYGAPAIIGIFSLLIGLVLAQEGRTGENNKRKFGKDAGIRK